MPFAVTLRAWKSSLSQPSLLGIIAGMIGHRAARAIWSMNGVVSGQAFCGAALLHLIAVCFGLCSGAGAWPSPPSVIPY